jgi:hypothetical protein
MKKILLTLGLAILMFAGVNAQFARKQMTIPRATGDIIIDGQDNDADWGKATEISNTEFWKYDPSIGDWGDFGPADGMPDEADFKVTYKVLNKAEGIYFFVKVNDNDLNIFNGNPDQSENFWEYDDLELYLHFQNQKLDSSLISDASTTSTTFRIFYNIGNDESKPLTSVVCGGDNDGYEPIEDAATKIIQCVGAEVSGGYVVEMYVPFKIWENTLLADGSNVPYQSIDSLGFELSILDVDSDDSKPDQILAWNEDSSYDKLVPWYPNYLGRIDFSEYAIGVEDEISNNNLLNCYPNPVSGNILNIESKNMQSVNISNIIGQQFVNINSINSDKLSIDISELKAGLYIVNTISNNGESSMQKIVIQ